MKPRNFVRSERPPRHGFRTNSRQPRHRALTLLTCSLLLMLAAGALGAPTTINAVNRYAYGANFGWMDWHADGANGVVIGEYVCSGYIYAANAGWIHLGDGTAADGIRYRNDSATDYGVNHDGAGNLRGYAYGANIGWVNFENRGAPKVDLKTGRLSGFIYAANAGWISLSNASAFVQTDTLARPDSDGDGIADAYEMKWAGDLARMNAATDQDGDGVSDRDEYLADTNPTDPNDVLRITAFSTTMAGLSSEITWTSRPTRCYWIRQREDLDPTTFWLDSGLGGQSPDEGPTTTRTVPGEASDMRFFRIEVVQPLSDNTPPPVPGGLRVVQLGPTHNRVSLAWDSVEDTGGSGLKEYILRRNDLEVVRPVLPFGVDAFLLPDREYSFSVAAVDMAGNVSAFSAPLVVHSLALVPVAGVRRVKVLLCKFQDFADEPFTIDHANDLVFDDPWSVSAYFNEVSYGRLTLDGDTSGWFALPHPAANYCGFMIGDQWYGCDMGRIQTDLNALLPDDVDLDAYDIVTVAVNGMGTAGLNAGNFNYVSAVNAFRQDSLAHEIGHGFNATMHAGSWDDCVDSPVGPDLLDLRAGGCSVIRYGDTYDPMGGGNCFHFSMYHKENMGFLRPENVATIEADGDYTLHQMEMPSADVQMLKILLPHDMFYFFEYRTEQGFNGPDNPVPSRPAFDGVLVRLRLTKSPGTDADTLIPGFPNFILNPGRPFIDPYRGLRIEVVEKLGDRVRLRVTGVNELLR